jgi:hypothetical protein
MVVNIYVTRFARDLPVSSARLRVCSGRELEVSEKVKWGRGLI